MIEGRTVIVVVPAFQEEARVANVVSTMPSFVDHIIVVDDGSSDATSARAREVGSARLRVVRHAERRGVGAAIVTGYRTGLGLTARPEDVFAVMAGDGQMDPADLRSVVLPIIRGSADYVKGNRFGAKGIRRTMGLPRFIGGQVFSLLTSMAIGQSITDSQCGYTALGRAAALRLDLDGLWPSFGYPNDLLGQLAARSLRIQEVPVRPIYGDEQSKLRLRHLPPIGFLVLRAAWRRRKKGGAIPRTDEHNEEKLRSDSAVSS